MTLRRVRWTLGLGTVSASLALAAACGGTDQGGGTAGPGYGGSSASGNTGGSSASGNTGGSSANGGTGGGLILDASTGDGALTDANACAAESQKAELVPLDLYIMLDRSGSMQGSKWSSVTSAIDTFVKDTASIGLGVGLDFFPDTPECSSSTYSTPSVPIGVLPNNATNISGALVSVASPYGGTPTVPAMQGAVDYTSNWSFQNPTHVVVIVLATDGVPNDCSSSVGGVATLAQNAANQNPAILTFVIGVGSALTNLNQIAAAGGTKQAFIVDTSQNVTQQFIDALNAIRGAVVACEYVIPTPEAGVIDPDKVNVQYTPGSGGTPVIWPKVADINACPPTGDGWYYDNPTSPTKVILCPNTCTQVKQDSNAEVSVLFGCKSVGPA
jgi:Mg-chelatase subunit ChlD